MLTMRALLKGASDAHTILTATFITWAGQLLCQRAYFAKLNGRTLLFFGGNKRISHPERTFVLISLIFFVICAPVHHG